ncbi:tektin-like protein 1 [Ascaphus truei]|uniref:tektin-like protein 1 n=1 Tax=Ascaphus truei TaxID=8439 RepID=UPI003F5A96C8
MAVSPIGSASWREASYRTIRLAHELRLRPLSTALTATTRQRPMTIQNENVHAESLSHEHVQPTPFHRDLISETCNALARGYMRDTRHSLSFLRQAIGETNRRIQRLQRERDILERSHANTRRDILTSQETVQLRGKRPKSERYPDKVDALLRDEKNGLVDLKRHSERQLQEISRQLQVLHSQRQTLSQFCNERSRVLEFLSETARSQPLGQETAGNSKPLRQENTECQAVIDDALVTCEKFRNTQPPNWQKPGERRELKENVTEGLRKKAEESAQIRDEVTLALGETRNFIQRQQKLYDETETNYLLQLGPVSSLDISVRERLDRPLVKILQRHPGTQLPESTLISQASASLQRSLESARESVGLLQLSRLRLQDDAESKKWGERIDQAAMRLRQRSAQGRRERLHL